MNQQTLTKQEKKIETKKPDIQVRKMTGLNYSAEGYIIDELPGGFLVGSELYRNVALDTLDGEVEELIADPKYQGNFEKLLTKLLKKLLQQLGPFDKQQINEEMVRQLLVADRDFLFFKIIQDNNGEILKEVKFPCPHCGTENTVFNFDTKSIDVHWNMNEVDETTEIFDSPCIFNGKQVESFTVRFPRGADHENLPATDNLGIRRTYLLKNCLIGLDNEKPEKGFNVQDIQKLKMKHRNKIYTVMADKNPGVDYMQKRVCSNCNKEYSSRVNLGSFF